jgi:hypothetical protein
MLLLYQPVAGILKAQVNLMSTGISPAPADAHEEVKGEKW